MSSHMFNHMLWILPTLVEALAPWPGLRHIAWATTRPMAYKPESTATAHSLAYALQLRLIAWLMVYSLRLVAWPMVCSMTYDLQHGLWSTA